MRLGLGESVCWHSLAERAKARWIEQLWLIGPHLSTFDELFVVCDLLGTNAKRDDCFRMLEGLPSLVRDQSRLAALPHGWLRAVNAGRPELIERARWVVGGLLDSENADVKAEAKFVLGWLERWASARGGGSKKTKGGRSAN